MISYMIRCPAGHEGEGWFQSSATFDRQAAEGLISCAVCGSTEISRAPMAPAVRGADKIEAREARALRMMALALRRTVEEKCDYVGPRFPEVARQIHYGETVERGIYGEATPDEAEALVDEGISIAAIPWIDAEN